MPDHTVCAARLMELRHGRADRNTKNPRHSAKSGWRHGTSIYMRRCQALLSHALCAAQLVVYAPCVSLGVCVYVSLGVSISLCVCFILLYIIALSRCLDPLLRVTLSALLH